MNAIADSSELIGVVDNSNLLPFSLNESQAEQLESRVLSQGESPSSEANKLKEDLYVQGSSSLLKEPGLSEALDRHIMEAVEQTTQEQQIARD